ncbi:nitroreductase/quinone reductase family protein [Caenibius sp. WL]|uniref:nitroreductase/quinone reductase family protein n=1 Tax=Caenibius sp. WL TaxID=2872646 RepID=UPI001C9907CD|nr:nitroreductase/quinone reductase family protein [Caenibius sp. WL]QZP08260.1 nitroreductase family deazaflavin-dependent oxidoreductase [Caenibius sp. WL]
MAKGDAAAASHPLAGHKQAYLRSGGREGHLLAGEPLRDGRRFNPMLLLRTIGRTSGQAFVTPLMYGSYGGELLVAASFGGADVHPSWYRNLTANGELAVQVATQAYTAGWREPQGEELAALWAYMDALSPYYAQYRAATRRVIPLIAILLKEPIPVFTE